MILCYEKKKMLTRSFFSDMSSRHFSNLSYSESPSDMPNRIPAFFLRNSALQINTDRHTSSTYTAKCMFFLLKVFPFQQNTILFLYCFLLLLLFFPQISTQFLETLQTEFNSFCHSWLKVTWLYSVWTFLS